MPPDDTDSQIYTPHNSNLTFGIFAIATLTLTPLTQKSHLVMFGAEPTHHTDQSTIRLVVILTTVRNGLSYKNNRTPSLRTGQDGSLEH